MTYPMRMSVYAGVLVLFAAGGGRAQGPGYGPIQTNPAYNPYLNLLRPGGSVFQNYFGLVRPEIEFRRTISGLQYQAAALSQQVGGLTESSMANPEGIRATGFRPGYFTQRKYFMTMGGATGSAAIARPGMASIMTGAQTMPGPVGSGYGGAAAGARYR